MMKLSALIFFLLYSASMAFSQGVLIPKDPRIPPVAIKHQRVNIDVKDGVASTEIEQVFTNTSGEALEATYVFPVPRGGSVTEFAMYMNGQRMQGELIDSDKAKKIYQDIVRRMKDPGLLEHMGDQLFKVSVYPVPASGDLKLELAYAQTLEFDAGLYKLVYPLKTNEKLCRTLEDFTVRARVRSSVPMKNVYSPTHQISVKRKGDHEVTVGFEEDGGTLDKDFVLFYGVSKKEFGLNLLTHRHNKKEDGYFMMMLAPSVERKDDRIIKKDVTFVFDTSGSMAVKKMDQAREALAYCVAKLNKQDRFNIVRFSTDVETFKSKLVPASKAMCDEAQVFVENLEARGGTNIDEALQTALRMRDGQSERPHIVVFLTDGKPTIGETQAEVIVKHVDTRNKSGARIFVFGVGDKVNTHLLDKISGGNGGASSYVFPEEDIEIKVSSFADKISSPVLSNLKLEVEGVRIVQQYPSELSDLFAGDQLSVIGRYKGSDHVAITLTGNVNGEAHKHVYEGTFPASNKQNKFVPVLWATRHIGYLLDEIRLHGENEEVKDEVVRLSKEFGIVTPYTSYLVVEDEEAPQVGGGRPLPPPGSPRPLPDVYFQSRVPKKATTSSRSLNQVAQSTPRLGAGGFVNGALATESQAAEDSATIAGDMLRRNSGRDALLLSEALGGYKEREVAAAPVKMASRDVEGHTFLLINGVWTDQAESKALEKRTIKFGSEAYFRLLEEKPELLPFFSLGEKVVVVLDQVVYIVD